MKPFKPIVMAALLCAPDAGAVPLNYVTGTTSPAPRMPGELNAPIVTWNDGEFQMEGYSKDAGLYHANAAELYGDTFYISPAVPGHALALVYRTQLSRIDGQAFTLDRIDVMDFVANAYALELVGGVPNYTFNTVDVEVSNAFETKTFSPYSQEGLDIGLSGKVFTVEAVLGPSASCFEGACGPADVRFEASNLTAETRLSLKVSPVPLPPAGLLLIAALWAARRVGTA